MSINLQELTAYPTAYSLVKEIEQRYLQLAPRYTDLLRFSANPLAEIPFDFSSLIQELISLIGQADAQIESIDDETIDVSEWLLYLSELDTLCRTWWRLPAIYGTGDNLGSLLQSASDEFIVSKEDTLNGVESMTGVPWQTVAQINRLEGAVERDAAWAGKKLMIPKASFFSRPAIPEVLGNQAGIAILGKDISNQLRLEDVEGTPTFSSHLRAACSDTDSELLLSDVSGLGTDDSGVLRLGDELMLYDGCDLLAATVTITLRGYRGTTATAHAANSTVNFVPFLTQLAVLDYTDTFIQGLGNTLESSTVQQIFGSDYGAVKAGIVTVTVIDALKTDSRVGPITNVQSLVEGDKIIISMDVNSIGRLARHTLQTYYHGNP